MSELVARTSQFFQQPPQQIWLKASAVLPPWVTLLLVVAIAWQLARIIWLTVPGAEPVPVAPPAPRAASTGTAGAADTVNIDAILNAHLFGTADATAPAPDEELEVVEDTRLNLELRGTISADEAGAARAIIAVENGGEKVYSIGDSVTGGATLHSVYTDRVLLRRAGQLEALRLPRADQSTGGSARRTASARRTPTRAANSILDVMTNSPVKLTDVIRPQPVFRDGKQQGYRVYPGRQRAQFAQLGLRPGDMITQINGMPLDDPARGMEIFRSLGDATQVSVTVERSGQPQVLTLDTSQFSAGSTDAAAAPGTRTSSRKSAKKQDE